MIGTTYHVKSSSMDIAISICYKEMRDMLLFSIYNGVVVCDYVGNEYLLYR